jgi:MoxR-like ATPase
MSHADVQQAANALLDELERAIVGKRQVLELVVTALLADGHVLLEDVPGVAKTAIARAVAEAGGLQFSRVQFTPDLIPADITGATILAGANAQPEFRPGPVFANLVLGDEINRAPPKTQSALLEAMEERQVTADAVTRPLPKPFLVIGTQNPIEQEGTYPLPEAQLDRFLIRTDIGYPGRDFEVQLIMRRATRKTDRTVLNPVLSGDDVLHLQRRVEEVHISEPVAQYVVDLVEATRTSTRTEAGASPRGSLALLKTSRARAAMAGRSHVLPDDVKAVAVSCLAHRLLLQPDQWVRGVRADQVINEIVSQVPAPRAIEPGDRTAGQQPQQVVQQQPAQQVRQQPVQQVPQQQGMAPQGVPVQQGAPPQGYPQQPGNGMPQPGGYVPGAQPAQPNTQDHPRGNAAPGNAPQGTQQGLGPPTAPRPEHQPPPQVPPANR